MEIKFKVTKTLKGYELQCITEGLVLNKSSRKKVKDSREYHAFHCPPGTRGEVIEYEVTYLIIKELPR